MIGLNQATMLHKSACLQHSLIRLFLCETKVLFTIHVLYHSIIEFPIFDLPNSVIDHFMYESVDRPTPLYAKLTFSEARESTLIYLALPIDPYLTRTK